jgi:predicted ATP-dependent endonuclease of OLD family
MKLKKVTIHKYKSIENDQTFEVLDGITVLVGMNESGKTSILEAIAKTNYFEDDSRFKFDMTHDFPRREKKAVEKSGEDPPAITCTYSIPEKLLDAIANDVGKDVLRSHELTVGTKYSNTRSWTQVKVDLEPFFEGPIKQAGITSKALLDRLKAVKNAKEFDAVVADYKDEKILASLATVRKYFVNEWAWTGGVPLPEYITRVYLFSQRPKFLYYDEYYALPSRISIEKLTGQNLDEDELKTAKALFDLADINVDELLESEEYEDFKAELEATQAIISDTLFKYWETNKNLEIEFNIDKVEKKDKRTVTNSANQSFEVEEAQIVEHVLDIRVKNNRSRVSLPLKNRSKGFNWFFSFLVWFMKIQEDKNSNYVLLLDEPGLNLHAAAQADLLRFLSDLANDYQVIFTTHSPFMIDSSALNQVRTVLETDNGSVISNSIQEKDPNTLFPLQAALGYDIAQNLFVSKNNLLVEGPADLVFLTFFSELLSTNGRTGLSEGITVVPVGGLDKVATFISLLRGSKLNVACLLDTFTDQKGKQRVKDLIVHKIIKEKKIRFFDEFATKGKGTADIEDLFEPAEYLDIFNAAFDGEHKTLSESELDATVNTIIGQINKAIGKERFNHFRPASKLVQLGKSIGDFTPNTIDRFETMFREINAQFD